MLLMNKSGRIYDVPEQIANDYVATNWKASKEAVGDMLDILRSRPEVSSESIQAMGCCNVYANYCPEK